MLEPMGVAGRRAFLRTGHRDHRDRRDNEEGAYHVSIEHILRVK
jgi:hypothetical protein